jgi:transposase
MKTKFNPTQLIELEKALKNKKYQRGYRRIQTVLLYAEGNPIKEVLKVTKYTKSTLYILVKNYLSGGLPALLSDARRSNYYYLTFEEESNFLETFAIDAAKGKIVTVTEMHVAYQEKVGKKTSRRAFYTLLSRHGWRKVMPRPQHPKKTSVEKIDASKKLTPKSKKRKSGY